MKPCARAWRIWRESKASMNCPLEIRDNAQLLLDYCTRKLEPESVAILERHIALCGACREFADRKSTRLNSSHRCRSYAVFCLKKKHFVALGEHLPGAVIGGEGAVGAVEGDAEAALRLRGPLEFKAIFFFFLIIRRPPKSTLFPYTPLFR